MWFTIPKPFELGITGTAFERLASVLKDGDDFDKAFQGYAGSLYRAAMPFSPEFGLGAFKPIFDTYANYSSFYGSTIISSDENDVAVNMREGTQKASNLGKAMRYIMSAGGFGPDVDPRKIDYVIKNWFSYFGDIAMATSNIEAVFGDTGGSKQFNWNLTGFMRERNPETHRSVQYLYQKAKEYRLFKTSDIVKMKEQLSAFEGATTQEGRDDAVKVLTEYTTNIEKQWKVNVKIYEKFLQGEEVEYNGTSYNPEHKNAEKNLRKRLFNN